LLVRYLRGFRDRASERGFLFLPGIDVVLMAYVVIYDIEAGGHDF
jgi:hypothetical protein